MDPQAQQTTGPVLSRLPANPHPDFCIPSKRINDGDDLTFFLSSTAYRDLMLWLLQLNRSVFPRHSDAGSVSECRLDSSPAYSQMVQNLRSLLSDLQNLIKDAPPDTGPRRFGNVAFRTWFKLAEQNAGSLIAKHLHSMLRAWGSSQSLVDELTVYLLGSFGSAQRLDYGTGHELSFLAFLACLWKLGAFEDGEERAIVVGLVQPYVYRQSQIGATKDTDIWQLPRADPHSGSDIHP